MIDTNFSARSQLPEPAQPEPRYRAGRRAQDSAGYDFSRLVQRVYQEEGMAPVHTSALRPPSPGPTFPLAPEEEAGFPTEKSCPSLAWAPSADGSIWSLELQGSLIVVGRSSGRLEVGSGGWREAGGGLGVPSYRCSQPLDPQVWDAIEGTLRCSSEEVSSGITALVFLDKRWER